MNYRVLLVPLLSSLYIASLGWLSEVPYYGGTFANNETLRRERYPDVSRSVSFYIANPQATGAFATLNVPPLAYMWLNPLMKQLSTPVLTISLAVFDVFWLLFLITPCTLSNSVHITVVACFISAYFVHVSTLLVSTVRISPPRDRKPEIAYYFALLLSLVSLVISLAVSAPSAPYFYVFECTTYIAAFYLVPVLLVLRQR